MQPQAPGQDAGDNPDLRAGLVSYNHDFASKFNRDVQEKNRFLYEMLGQPAPEQYIFLSPRTGKPYSLEYINRLLKVFKVRYRLPIRHSPHIPSVRLSGAMSTS